MGEDRHKILVNLDYRVAHTVVLGCIRWLQKLLDLLDKAAREAGEFIPERRKNGGDRRENE